VISKDEFKTAMSIKKKNEKITKSYIKQSQAISMEEKCENYKTAFMQELSGVKPDLLKLANTNMDKAIQKNKLLEKRGKLDLEILSHSELKTGTGDRIYLFETDKFIAEEYANGH
jgi:hypothetical protein